MWACKVFLDCFYNWIEKKQPSSRVEKINVKTSFNIPLSHYNIILLQKWNWKYLYFSIFFTCCTMSTQYKVVKFVYWIEMALNQNQNAKKKKTYIWLIYLDKTYIWLIYLDKTYIWLIYLDKTYILFNSGLDFFVSFCDLINSLAWEKKTNSKINTNRMI